VGERERAVAFLTTGPLRPGHALVIPRRHAVTLEDVRPEDWLEVAELAREVAGRQRDHLGATGQTLVLASGKDGEQSVFHLHLHVVPRTASDGLDLTSWWDARTTHPPIAELEKVARRLVSGSS